MRGTLINLITKEKIKFHDATIQLNYPPSNKLEDIRSSWCFEVRWGGRKILKEKKKHIGQAFLLIPEDGNFPRKNILVKNIRFGTNTLIDGVEPKDNFDVFRFAQRLHEKNARKKLKNRKRVSRNIISPA